MKLKTGNILTGKVVAIEEGQILTRVKVDLGDDDFITVLVSEAALRALGAQVGDELEVLKDVSALAARKLH